MMSRALALLVASTTLVSAHASAQSDPTLAKILGDVQAAYNKGDRPIVVFDVDGTLLDNRPRILRILQEFSGEKQYITPDAAQKLKALTVQMIQYRLPDTLQAAGITDMNVRNNAAAFWGERFFTNDYLEYDQPTPGSSGFVRRLYSTGARIIYLTGRDLPRQYLGTMKALYEKGYPIGIQGTELIMKPTTAMQDAVFKQQVTSYLRVTGTVVATFDNEPSNANVYRRAFPKATVVIFSAPHSPNPPPLLPNIVRLNTFQ